jgi:hypothetical protein
MLLVVISLSASPSCSDSQLPPSSAINQQCTLAIINGSVKILISGATDWVPGSNGMTLNVGTRINTLPDSKAMLTFYNGSTVELDQSTDLEIQKNESGGKSSSIVLKQILGKSVNRVVELLDPGSRYEIQTPSAYALVRGTLFSVEVDGLKNTTVKVIENAVIVGARGQTVSVPAGYQVTVLFGSPPPPPVQISGIIPSSSSAGLFTGSMTPGLQSAGGQGPGIGQLQQMIPPAVVATNPMAGEITLAAARPITATFNVPMNPATLNATSFTLIERGFAIIPVAGTVTYNLLTATFMPNAALVPSRPYAATITTAAISEAGLHLANNYVWVFATAGP